jgi:molybdopterin converting factor small subunit
MPEVHVPPPYQGPTLGNGRIPVEGATVLACLEAVGEKYPGFLDQVLDADGSVHRFVQLFVNGDEIDRSALSTPVGSSDRVEILAAIAGG